MFNLISSIFQNLKLTRKKLFEVVSTRLLHRNRLQALEFSEEENRIPIRFNSFVICHCYPVNNS